MVDHVDGRPLGEGFVLPLPLWGPVVDEAGLGHRTGGSQEEAVTKLKRSVYHFVLFNFLAIPLEVNGQES